MWKITIPNWVPPSLNTARGRHWKASEKNTQECANMVAAYAQKAGVPKVHGPGLVYRPRRRLTVDVVKYGKLPDPDNLLKHLLDGLKLAGLICDDSRDWCQWETPKLEQLKGPPQLTGWGTVLTLSDIPDDLEPEPAAPVQGEQFGVTLTRAVVRHRAWHKGGEADFFIYHDGPTEEAVFLHYTAADAKHLERLAAWARERLGLVVVTETIGLPAEKPAPVPAVRPDPDLFD